MRLGFETLGNATIVLYDEGRPVLATDPWLEGRCYFGSWALERRLTDAERATVLQSDYLWISHGHPDHFHVPSLLNLPRDKKILLPDHYAPDIKKFLEGQGFPVEVLRYKQWRQISPQVRCMCLDNENQDAILLIETGNNLIVNLNDSPLCGEASFIAGLVRKYDRSRTYMAALCSNDADMLNIVDAEGRLAIDPPERRKPGMVWERGRLAKRLGVGHYVGSASQHIYSRADTVWANPYRVGWSDVIQNWAQPDIDLIEPFVVLDLQTGQYERKNPSFAADDGQILMDQNGDDWAEKLEPAEWDKLFAYFKGIELLRPYIDYLDFTIGGEKRRLWINERASTKPEKSLRGIGFEMPRRSLVRGLQFGYFDDLLIGNFMRTTLHNTTLYPHFSPIVAKLRGSARVSTFAELRKFRWRYFSRNPIGYLSWQLEQQREQWIEAARRVADFLGVKGPLKRLYRRLLGDPVTP